MGRYLFRMIMFSLHSVSVQLDYECQSLPEDGRQKQPMRFRRHFRSPSHSIQRWIQRANDPKRLIGQWRPNQSGSSSAIHPQTFAPISFSFLKTRSVRWTLSEPCAGMETSETRKEMISFRLPRLDVWIVLLFFTSSLQSEQQWAFIPPAFTFMLLYRWINLPSVPVSGSGPPLSCTVFICICA